MNRSTVLNGGAYARSAFLAIGKTATAGGAGDATEVNSDYVDRALADVGFAQSAKLVITYTATLAEGKTLSFAGNFQDATKSDGTAVADYSDAFAAHVVATGATGGSTETGTFEVDVDLSGAREFVRAQITPDLSATATDTCSWSAALVLFGDQRHPSTKAVASIASADAI